MTRKNGVYRCNMCGNIVELLHAGAGKMVCCGQPMELLEENSVDAAQEKHVPVLEKTLEGFRVSVGSAPHPMSEEHLIEWIEILADGKVYRQNLAPGNEPVASFRIKADEISARAYCNLHGLWKS
ncbi:MAG: desulfoferrodoxin [Desulfobulbaceae bacterium]|nr:desulfoferrodoxin [Desulfobulbaceae bacterium]